MLCKNIKIFVSGDAFEDLKERVKVTFMKKKHDHWRM